MFTKDDAKRKGKKSYRDLLTNESLSITKVVLLFQRWKVSITVRFRNKPIRFVALSLAGASADREFQNEFIIFSKTDTPLRRKENCGISLSIDLLLIIWTVLVTLKGSETSSAYWCLRLRPCSYYFLSVQSCTVLAFSPFFTFLPKRRSIGKENRPRY